VQKNIGVLKIQHPFGRCTMTAEMKCYSDPVPVDQLAKILDRMPAYSDFELVIVTELTQVFVIIRGRNTCGKFE
jgi:hypothetical protein